MSQPKNAIELEGAEALTDDSVEVARIWVTDGAGSSVWIDAGVLADPHVFGILMAETVRHAARAYATSWGLAEDDALERITEGLVATLEHRPAAVIPLRPPALN